MASQWPPKKNTAFSFEIGLFSQADSTTLKSGPTLAAGDFKFSLDGSAPASITNTPTASGTVVTVALIAAEMNGDRVHIVWQDAAGAEWVSGYTDLFTSARTNDDLAFPATTGRSMVVDAAGLVDANVVKLGPSGSGTAQTARDVGGNVDVAVSTRTKPADTQAAVTLVATTTNLTNAPTVGDLTAAMKASVTAAVPTAAATATAVLSAASAAPIAADTKKMNGSTVNGTGTSGDLWRGA